jgi:hypothetical protein
MTENVCYVHAEDWKSIGFISAQHIADASAWLDDASPTTAHPNTDLREHKIPLSVLDSVLSSSLRRADELLTGYANDIQSVPQGFAYYDEDFGAVYGTASDGMVDELYFANMFCDCGKDFSAAMSALESFGKAHQLVMVDWELEVLIDLRQPEAMQQYYDEM